MGLADLLELVVIDTDSVGVALVEIVRLEEDDMEVDEDVVEVMLTDG